MAPFNFHKSTISLVCSNQLGWAIATPLQLPLIQMSNWCLSLIVIHVLAILNFNMTIFLDLGNSCTPLLLLILTSHMPSSIFYNSPFDLVLSTYQHWSMSSTIYIEPSILDLLSKKQETFTCILTPIGQVTLLTTVWLLAISHTLAQHQFPGLFGSVTNFIRPYLHQFFDDSHSLNGS